MASPITGTQLNSLASGFLAEGSNSTRTPADKTQSTVQTSAVDNARIVPRDGVELSSGALRASQDNVSRQLFESTTRTTPSGESANTTNDRAAVENAPLRNESRVTFEVNEGSVEARVVTGGADSPIQVERQVPTPGSFGNGQNLPQVPESGEERVGENLDLTA